MHMYVHVNITKRILNEAYLRRRFIFIYISTPLNIN